MHLGNYVRFLLSALVRSAFGVSKVRGWVVVSRLRLRLLLGLFPLPARFFIGAAIGLC